MSRSRGILLIFLFSSLAAAGALTYKRWPQLFRQVSKQQPETSSSQNELVSTPPFSTKEPDRYQATRVITSVDNKNGSVITQNTKIMIARDGARRREVYVTGADDSGSHALVYLETPDGRFVLMPAKKLYADLDLAAQDSGSFTPPNDAGDFSPERLLHETRAQARYEKLGAEIINERATTKYRVTAAGAGESANGTSVSSVTLIWIDELLGIPIRSETSVTDTDRSTRVIVELQDLKQTIDPRIFDLPKDYQKVDYRQLAGEMTPGVGALAGERSKSGKP
jgi:hypothetical protein